LIIQEAWYILERSYFWSY